VLPVPMMNIMNGGCRALSDSLHGFGERTALPGEQVT